MGLLNLALSVKKSINPAVNQKVSDKRSHDRSGGGFPVCWYHGAVVGALTSQKTGPGSDSQAWRLSDFFMVFSNLKTVTTG